MNISTLEAEVLARVLMWRRRSDLQRLVRLGDQRLIHGQGGTNYDGFGYQL